MPIKMNEPMINEKLYNFWLFSYFGMDLKEISFSEKQTIMFKCAQAAYQDLKRTLRFNKTESKVKNSEKNIVKAEHLGFCNEICKIICQQVPLLLNCSNMKEFDEKHRQICELIKAKANDSDKLIIIKNGKEYLTLERTNEKLYYGQSQKWLNMTLKYMWLLGLWKNEFDKIVPFMHIPVDSFIIESVWKDTNIKLPSLTDRAKKEYSDDKVVPWSKWTFEEYIGFQDSLRTNCVKKNPIEWEISAWIDIARKRKEDEYEIIMKILEDLNHNSK